MDAFLSWCSIRTERRPCGPAASFPSVGFGAAPPGEGIGIAGGGADGLDEGAGGPAASARPTGPLAPRAAPAAPPTPAASGLTEASTAPGVEPGGGAAEGLASAARAANGLSSGESGEGLTSGATVRAASVETVGEGTSVAVGPPAAVTGNGGSGNAAGATRPTRRASRSGDSIER
jgi:hypothetical protein